MGEVYRARDKQLNREVAIKVMPPPMQADADSLARFQREAQVLASLSHPNIAVIHGLEVAGPIRAIVMELVEGPTLADRLREGALRMGAVSPPGAAMAANYSSTAPTIYSWPRLFRCKADSLLVNQSLC